MKSKIVRIEDCAWEIRHSVYLGYLYSFPPFKPFKVAYFTKSCDHPTTFCQKCLLKTTDFSSRVNWRFESICCTFIRYLFTLWRKIELIFASSLCLVDCLISFRVFFCLITWVPLFLTGMQLIIDPMCKTLASILDVCIESIHGKWIAQAKTRWNTTMLSRDFARKLVH